MKKMMTLCLLLAGCGCLLAGGQRERPAAMDQEAVEVMTFNIRYGSADDGEDSWPHRKGLVMEVIREHAPDLVGLQEALRFQLDEMHAAVPGYGEIGVGREPGGEGEYSAIFYLKERFSVEESDTFWLSDTPEISSTHWGNKIVRICTWARLLDNKTGKRLYFYNTHFDHQSQPSRENSARLLAKRIVQRRYPDPVIVTGDFNAGEDNPAITYLTGRDSPLGSPPVQLVDSFRILHPEEKTVGTFNSFKGENDGDKIDYVFVLPGTQVKEAAIVRDNQGGKYPSDHYPVSAQVLLRPIRIVDDPAMLDFWVGEWDLTWQSKDGLAKGTNTISKTLDGAVIHESFNGQPGMDFHGRSYSVLSRADGQWKQVWVDSANGYLDFDGYKEGEKVVFHRKGMNPKGETIFQRMVFYDIMADSLTWDWETSPDGKEWTLRWRIQYKRRADAE